jgi:hypothetical protein
MDSKNSQEPNTFHIDKKDTFIHQPLTLGTGTKTVFQEHPSAFRPQYFNDDMIPNHQQNKNETTDFYSDDQFLDTSFSMAHEADPKWYYCSTAGGNKVMDPNLSQESSVHTHTRKLTLGPQDCPKVSFLPSEEYRLNLMLEKLSKADDDKVVRSNWWEDDSKLASMASPRSRISSMERNANNTSGISIDGLLKKISSFFEDLKLDCNMNLCSEEDDHIGHEIDVEDGLQSMVEDDITLDFNSNLVNTPTTAFCESEYRSVR